VLVYGERDREYTSTSTTLCERAWSIAAPQPEHIGPRRLRAVNACARS
jgi:hypothetical protein